jgi:hypothetical protein
VACVNRYPYVPPMLKRLGAVLGLLVLCAISILRVARPPAAVPATAPDTAFSAERALRHEEEIAQRPHAMGTTDHDRVRDYIVAQLGAMGVHSQIQLATAVGTRYQEAGRVQNILASIPGSDPNGKALLLMVHYDGVEAGPAAADDGAGAAALLETVRALRARKQPLAHDVIVLFTDGEESGLLGAAAFVREHRWAKDVAMVLNFEARGTSGRSLMFETGPGNLDAARLLRAAGHATAGSVYTTIYRMLPNDTDLSELAVLGLPALNFAFADGVERYHTSRDDVAHLNPGSLQHHGVQMLALATLIGNGPLPRPTTGDGVFFDLPLLGLVTYPDAFALPLAILALVLIVIVVVRDRTGVLAGAGIAVAALALSLGAGVIAGKLVRGTATWSGWYAAAIALLAVAVTVACYAAGKRWSGMRGMFVGAMIVWVVLALLTSATAPGTSYLFVWPVLFAAAAALVSRGREVVAWVSATITLLIMAGFIYGVSVVMLGVTGAGAIALAVVSSLVTLLLIPVIETIANDVRWSGAGWIFGAAAAVLVVALAVVRPSTEHPLRTAVVYAENADAPSAWIGVLGVTGTDWSRQVIGARAPAPAWTRNLLEYGSALAGHEVPRVALDAPNALLVRDTLLNGARRIVLRVTSPAGTTGLLMRALGAKVLTSSIDGRIVDTTRYRFHSPQWVMQYWAVPDSGAIVALSVPAGAHIDFELSARRPGIPPIPGVTIPPRPAFVVPSQTGDVSVVYRKLMF